MAFIGFRVSDQLASRFEAIAGMRGGKSKLLRTLVEAATTAPPDAAAGATRARGDAVKVTVRFSPEDLVRLDAASNDAGLRRTEWVVACVRARLGTRPLFNHDQAMALLESRRELRRIGVNLRSLGRALAEREQATASDIAKIEAFHVEVRRELASLRGALDGNRAYWRGEP